MSESASQQLRAAPTATLPLDLLEQQSLRMQMFYLIGASLWCTNLLMDAWLAPNGDRGPYRLAIEAAGVAIALATAAFARFGRARPSYKIEVGVFGIVPHALGLALLNSWAAQSVTMRPLSGVTVLILFFGMMAPGRPGRMLAAAVLAASMDPLGVWIAHLRGLPVPGPVKTMLLFYPNYICAALSVAPAHLLYALGRKLRAARALGSYQLIERLGEGGMGEVWRGRHRLLARSAAIKLVRPEVLGAGGGRAATVLQRFRREAQATAALTSPHTIRVYDFGLSDAGRFYYVMELLDGSDLDTIVRRFGPMPPARALAIVRQMCLSLAEAHARGLVHRDVKPANVFLCRMGLEYDFVKVLDFGLVKLDPYSAVTIDQTASVPIGTPGYMAPEAIIGSAPADATADVYAIGCVAYFLLTGHTVFKGQSPIGTLMLHVQDTPMPPSMRTELPISPEIDAFVLACLEKDPARRPRNAAEVLDRLDRTSVAGTWNQPAAAHWWRTHLPHLAHNDPIELPAWDQYATPTPQVPGETVCAS
jgi:serine/threonine protein kinase